jgi:hypothetical protein
MGQQGVLGQSPVIASDVRDQRLDGPAQDRHEPWPMPRLRAGAVHDDPDGAIATSVPGVVSYIEIIDRDEIAEA